MNLASTLLALALLGMDDTTAKPGLAPKESAEIATKVDVQTATKPSPSDRVPVGTQDLN
jgi:hypothetical protein